MLLRTLILSTTWLLLSGSSLQAQATLPTVEQADWPALRQNGERLLEALDFLKAQLPEPTRRAARDLLRSDTKDADAVRRLQELLDPHCLLGVHVNPESRVKAARGPAIADLRHDAWTVHLAKVHNEAGVTQRLAMVSPHAGGPDIAKAGDRWLATSVFAQKPMPAKLSGHELEYVILLFYAREVGKREARLIFDVGQGTQDLGFRAEVPILFTIKSAEK